MYCHVLYMAVLRLLKFALYSNDGKQCILRLNFDVTSTKSWYCIFRPKILGCCSVRKIRHSEFGVWLSDRLFGLKLIHFRNTFDRLIKNEIWVTGFRIEVETFPLSGLNRFEMKIRCWQLITSRMIEWLHPKTVQVGSWTRCSSGHSLSKSNMTANFGILNHCQISLTMHCHLDFEAK